MRIAPDAPSPVPNRLPPRRVVILATPTAQSLEVAGPVEVFAMVALKLREAGRTLVAPYAVEVVSAVEDRRIRSPAGLTLLAHRSFRDVEYEIDTLLVAGGMEVWSGADEPGLLGWVRERSRRARRFGSVCTGAFLLAQAGLLDGRRVTTHWYFCQQLQREHPRVVVDPEPIFIREGNLSTSAGVASGLDLALAMVEEDYGQDIALRIARGLVLFLRRPGGERLALAGPDEGMPGCTAAAFGRHAVDRTSLYVTTTGGLLKPFNRVVQTAKLVRLEVGVEGAPIPLAV